MVIHLDFETYSSVPIDKAGAFKYIESDDFEILLCAYSVDNQPVEILDLTVPEEKNKFNTEIKELLFRPDTLIAAYNAPFEAACIAKHFGIEITLEYAAKFRCTMFHGLYCGYIAGLDAVGKALGLPEDKRKLTIGKALIRYFCVPCKPTKTNGGRTRNLPKHDTAKWNLFKEYCAGDVVTEMEVEKRLSSFPVPYDLQKQWELDLVSNARGVAVDMDLVHGALEIAEKVRADLTKEAIELTGLENPNSVAQLSKWLSNNAALDLADLRKDTVARLLNGKLVSGAAERVLKIRQELGKTSTKKYDAIKSSVCADGRVRGLLQFYGAGRTGRWAGRIVQIQNLVRTYIQNSLLPLARDIVKKGEIDKLCTLFGSPMDMLSQLTRTAFVASDGCVLIDADFSSIEARVVAWLAKEQWVMDVFKTHGKIYEATAAQMFNVPIERIKKGNPEYALRQRGKVATLALGYAGGAGALKAMGAVDLGIPEDDLSDIVARWRQANPRIVDLWGRVESAATNVIKTGRQTGTNGLIFAREINYTNKMDFMTIKLPCGRKLYYAEPSIGENKWGKPSIAHYGVDQTTRQWTQLETFGGRLTENIVQAIARDCLAVAIERLETAGYHVIFHVHDEVVIECLEDKADLNNVIKIMSEPIPWAHDLPLKADGWTGNFFKKD